MRMISGKKAAELSAMYPSSAFFSDPSIHMEYASWKKGEILVSAFDMPKYLIFLFSGTVKISAYRDDGSEFVLPTVHPRLSTSQGAMCTVFSHPLWTGDSSSTMSMGYTGSLIPYDTISP